MQRGGFSWLIRFLEVFSCLIFLMSLNLLRPGSTVENVKEVLKLSVEQKGVVVPTGELTVYLDGLTVSDQEELAPLTNGNTANSTSECLCKTREKLTCFSIICCGNHKYKQIKACTNLLPQHFTIKQLFL